jgi:hypothetical protein
MASEELQAMEPAICYANCAAFIAEVAVMRVLTASHCSKLVSVIFSLAPHPLASV